MWPTIPCNVNENEINRIKVDQVSSTIANESISKLILCVWNVQIKN